MDKTSPSEYINEIQLRAVDYSRDPNLCDLASKVLDEMNKKKYAYNFHWLGRPIIQIPQDTVTFQEMIWEVKPDCIIETGIAHGGSLIFSASMLAILQACNLVVDPIVIGIDIDIRPHNRQAIEEHPLSKYIHMIESSSVSKETVLEVSKLASTRKRVMVFLDSNHSHQHVLAELEAYASLVTPLSYCVVLDTGIENLDPAALNENRVWGRGNSPLSALEEFMQISQLFERDNYYHQKCVVSSFPSGIIRRIGL